MLNHIIIMGRLTRDPELRITQSGVSVASFTVAVERDFGNSGERLTDFIDCVAWRQAGEFVHNYFRKGSMIVVSGQLQSRKWQDRDGNNRTSWEINADRCYFGESKKDVQRQEYSADQYGPRGTYQQPAQQQPAQQYRPAGAGVNVYLESGDGFREMPGTGSDNPFVRHQQQGMWDDLNDGDLPF